ncbi:ComF family protein [Thalassolituus sp. LLYu03]|uniref:ComF family protein n=1 Tax=Thalassolituus sp. LLYu03 TaxID=3421656 RepID=UPI003D2E11EB
MAEPGRCGRCQSHPPAFDYCHSPLLYSHPIAGWIRAIKDDQQLNWIHRLLWLMLQEPPLNLDNIDALVVMPSSRRRLITRGYNVAGMLADRLSQHYGKPLILHALHKRHTTDQRGLSAKERHRNQKRAMNGNQLDLSGQHLLLIDDVMTTGATAGAAANALKKQGASIVGIWVLARTPAH